MPSELSELVTNSVRHSGASAGASVVVRVQLTDSLVRLEVGDPGCEGVIAPRAPDLEGGGGFGPNLVGTCSERWGLERGSPPGSRVSGRSLHARRRHPSPEPRHDRGRTLLKTTRQPAVEAARQRRRPPEERMTMTEVQVVPDQRTAWRVYDTDAEAPVSEHTNATEAELAARARGADRVVVHDRYHRTHDAAPSPAGQAAREQLERTRRLERVRERVRQLARVAR